MTDKIQQARRAAFEAWYRSKFPASELRIQNLIGTYTKTHADLSWQAFNAALDAVEIELPKLSDQPVEDHYNWSACELKCRAAIESTNLGLKIR